MWYLRGIACWFLCLIDYFSFCFFHRHLTLVGCLSSPSPRKAASSGEGAGPSGTSGRRSVPAAPSWGGGVRLGSVSAPLASSVAVEGGRLQSGCLRRMSSFLISLVSMNFSGFVSHNCRRLLGSSVIAQFSSVPFPVIIEFLSKFYSRNVCHNRSMSFLDFVNQYCCSFCRKLHFMIVEILPKMSFIFAIEVCEGGFYFRIFLHLLLGIFLSHKSQLNLNLHQREK
jgi:hypothetical protein